jgi:predicted Zn-dependent protease
MTQEQIEELRKFATASKNRPDLQVEHVVFRAAANPAAILALIAEIDSLRDQVNGLTGTADLAEKQLKESRKNDRDAMSWIADCKEAAGFYGSIMPAFVEYLRDMKQRANDDGDNDNRNPNW